MNRRPGMFDRVLGAALFVVFVVLIGMILWTLLVLSYTWIVE